MAVSVSYPGVYVEEFTPGAPIAGVGTSTAAFVGTAVQGPAGVPTRIFSWDEYAGVFGGFPLDGPASDLARGVYAFFLNGGTDCYVLRVATGIAASLELSSRGAGGVPLIRLTARAEGTAGDNVSVTVADSSRLATLLQRAEPGSDGRLRVHRASTPVRQLEADGVTVTVDSSAGFAPGDRLLLSTAGRDLPTNTVAQATGDRIVLTTALSPQDLAGWTVRSADLLPGTSSFRVDVPAGLPLGSALPPGSVVEVGIGSGASATSEVATVATAGGDTVTLTAALSDSYSLADPAALPSVASLEFDLRITDGGSGRTESFPGLSTSATHPAYWVAAVTSDVVSLGSTGTGPAPGSDPRPQSGTFPLAGGSADDRALAWSQLTSAPGERLDLLAPFGDISLVAVPGAVDAAVQQAVRDHCETTPYRFALLDARPGAAPDEVLDQFADVRSAGGYAALYYPWISVRHPVTGLAESWAPSGSVAGLFAHTDAVRGVHKAPANVALRGAFGVERRLTDAQQGPLNAAGVNVLRVFPGQAQPVVWGARTTAGDLDRNWQYVNVRRLFLFLERSIEEGIRWAVFEPNDLGLWQRIKRTITEFLTSVWRDGALFGATADHAFYVRVDEALNPPSSRALGQLRIEVGVAPVYPAEFVVLRIGIWQGGSAVTEA